MGRTEVWAKAGRGAVLMAGVEPNKFPTGTKPGDVIHVFQSGSIQMLTDVVIDPAGDVWAANNWNDRQVVLADVPPSPTSTWGRGSGFTVIYGVAAPVKTPLMGQVQKA